MQSPKSLTACFACHGPYASHQKAELRQDVAKVAYNKEGENSFKAIKPGKPGSSKLVYRILSADPDMVMDRKSALYFWRERPDFWR